MLQTFNARMSALCDRYLLHPEAEVLAAIQSLANVEQVRLDDDVAREWANKIARGRAIRPK